MKKVAVEKARGRVNRAASAMNGLEKSADFASFSIACTDFLLAANSVFSILEKGAKDNATSRQWYGGKKKQCRQDPLIRYLVQARNADEHGIEPVAVHAPGSFAIGAPGESVLLSNITVNAAGHTTALVHSVGGKLPTVEVQPPHPKLVAVYDDRFGGEWFQPPTKHLGMKLPSATPLPIARLMVRFLTNLVDEAASYIRYPPHIVLNISRTTIS
ncbi:hypothetical protein VSX64_05105 [Aurantimonas sp. C2-6-R+9]|uniref:hypothetical protein n=1 Tax=unclassified Aurantimonas TaxID=2638230 RepID=UPI002E171743|nr:MULTISPECIES: hypothetical protein [unclassified Aurantimonas]MEC5290153.1 hypothetical protein [Aurantimonas sp. C2-3-R2]MEC5380266.1 hypothetical protein [Aurantimonas sp. C2-6-R+9]MEC5411217.1 hypothetical protein [Aurantimonas sp. C2-4-R8]